MKNIVFFLTALISTAHPWTMPPVKPRCSENDSCKSSTSATQEMTHADQMTNATLTHLDLLEHVGVIADLPQLHDGVHQSLSAAFTLKHMFMNTQLYPETSTDLQHRELSPSCPSRSRRSAALLWPACVGTGPSEAQTCHTWSHTPPAHAHKTAACFNPSGTMTQIPTRGQNHLLRQLRLHFFL